MGSSNLPAFLPVVHLCSLAAKLTCLFSACNLPFLSLVHLTCLFSASSLLLLSVCKANLPVFLPVIHLSCLSLPNLCAFLPVVHLYSLTVTAKLTCMFSAFPVYGFKKPDCFSACFLTIGSPNLSAFYLPTTFLVCLLS